MNVMHQKIGAWSGLTFGALFGLGFWLFAGFIPPPSPALNPSEVAGMFQQHAGMIRLGILLTMAGAGAFAPWASVISVQMKRIKGCDLVLVYSQLSCGAATIALLIMAAVLWTTAAYRPERSADLIVALNDLAWFLMVMPFIVGLVQNFAIGLAILADKGVQPVFPRWAGYFNLWTGLLFLPGGLVTFFKTGPFAWNGVLAFWLPAIVFFGWIVVMTVLLLRAIRQQAATT